MSLINQMLQDLEKRRAQTTTASALGGITPNGVVFEAESKINYFMLVIILVLVVTVAFLIGAQSFHLTKILPVQILESVKQEKIQSSIALTPVPTLMQQESISEPVNLSEVSSAKAAMGVASHEPVSMEMQDVESIVQSTTQPVNADVQPPALVATKNVVTEKVAVEKVIVEKKTTVPVATPSTVVQTEQVDIVHPVTSHQAEESEPEFAPTESVEKRTRPLTKMQRAELAFQQAVTLVGRDKHDRAIEVLTDVLELDPVHVRGREILASLLLNNGRVIEASTVLETGLNLIPASPPLAKLYARILFNQGDIEKSIGVLEQSAKAVQDDLEYYALLAAFYQRANRFAEAAGVYRRILNSSPGVANWWLGLGLSEESLGNSTKALEAYRQARQVGGLTGEVGDFVTGRINSIQASMSVKTVDNNKHENIPGERF